MPPLVPPVPKPPIQLIEDTVVLFALDNSQSITKPQNWGTCQSSQQNLRFDIPDFMVSLLKTIYFDRLDASNLRVGVMGLASKVDTQAFPLLPIVDYDASFANKLKDHFGSAHADGNKFQDVFQEAGEIFQSSNAKTKILVLISDGWLRPEQNNRDLIMQELQNLLNEKVQVVMVRLDCQIKDELYSPIYQRADMAMWKSTLGEANIYSGEDNDLLKKLLHNPIFVPLLEPIQNALWLTTADFTQEIPINFAGETEPFTIHIIANDVTWFMFGNLNMELYDTQVNSAASKFRLEGFGRDYGLNGNCASYDSTLKANNPGKSAFAIAWWITDTLDTTLVGLPLSLSLSKNMLVNLSEPIQIFPPNIAWSGLPVNVSEYYGCYDLWISLLDEKGHIVDQWSNLWRNSPTNLQVELRNNPQLFLGPHDLRFIVQLVKYPQDPNRNRIVAISQKEIVEQLRVRYQPDLRSSNRLIDPQCRDSQQRTVDRACQSTLSFDYLDGIYYAHPEYPFLKPTIYLLSNSYERGLDGSIHLPIHISSKPCQKSGGSMPLNFLTVEHPESNDYFAHRVCDGVNNNCISGVHLLPVSPSSDFQLVWNPGVIDGCGYQKALFQWDIPSVLSDPPGQYRYAVICDLTSSGECTETSEWWVK